MNLKLQDISKSYGNLKANAHVTLDIPSGMVLGILGENGAGKSTLMKILSGLISKDEGQVFIDGMPVEISSPENALKLGIGMLHQEPRDFPSMSIIENLMIGNSKPNVSSNACKLEIENLLNNLGFSLDLDGDVSSLSMGERQELELVRLLWQGVNVLILDEPTTGISALQKKQLFQALRKIIEAGKTILFVSHKLDEIQVLCDRAAVMRRGHLVNVESAPFKQEQLIELMFGAPVSRISPCRAFTNQAIMRIDKLQLDDSKIKLHNVSTEIFKGEVIGLAGMAGSGQKQFLQALAGLLELTHGSIYFNDKKLSGKSCFHFQREGIIYVPSDRLDDGLLPGMTVAEHFCLVEKTKEIFIDRKNIDEKTSDKIKKFRIKGNGNSPIESLSGGNQQRLMLSMLKENASILLLEDPTRGLDIESANWVWGLLRNRCDMGEAIVFSSADLEELLFYSDRIMVFFSGFVTEPIPVSQLDEEKLGSLIGGKGFEKIHA